MLKLFTVISCVKKKNKREMLKSHDYTNADAHIWYK